MTVRVRWMVGMAALGAAWAGAVAGLPAGADAAEPSADGITVSEAPFRTFGRSVTAVYVIDAPPAAVFQVLTDYDHMAEFMPMVDAVRALETRPNGAKVRYDLRYLNFFDIVEIDERTYQKPHRITWHAIEGPLKVSDGSWTLVPAGKGTRVTYQTDVDPGIPVPPAMVGHMLKQGLPEVLTAIRLRVETKGAWRKPR